MHSRTKERLEVVIYQSQNLQKSHCNLRSGLENGQKDNLKYAKQEQQRNDNFENGNIIQIIFKIILPVSYNKDKL